ncbi:hypothetical protein HELRODRAFT_88379 [Helobdella robusta]|uniref:Ubinuclein middle domain-containing protein n=1 Tax=Helobdella robusta TaxID=6412 RepID=T1G721_HELRO|nr:hypothetical protein HELRODRAFT_88379 [Helobdella robusta]ESN93593.1 hypothetical protein HELRODRAFT_88379 [Helobdella robusta]
MTSGDDDDNNNNENDALNRSDSDKLKRIMAPRKKFPWTSEIRELLCDVVQLRLVHYNMSRIKSQTADEHIRQFLDAEVKNLWPPGWMQTRILYKESKVVHQRLTSADS